MSKLTFLRLLVLGVAGSFLVSACGASQLQITNTPIPTIAGKTASFDVIEVDQGNHRLYVADRTDQGVDVFDISSSSAKYLQTIALPSSPNGLAIARDLSRLYVGTATGSVVFIDINPLSPTRYTVLRELQTGGKSADLLDYGAARHELYASNGVEGSITSIDAQTGDIKAHFNVGYALEQPRFNSADGMLYVASPDADAMFRIDPNDGTIKNKLALGGCQPTGLAINPQSNQALIACRTSVLSWDFRTGSSLKFLQVTGGDVVSYDAKVDRFFVASPHQTGPGAVGMFGGNPIAYISSAVIDTAGNSAAYDETNDVLYTTDIRPNKAGLASFRVSDSGQVALPSPTTFGIFAAILVVVALLFIFVGRSADPIRRREAEPKPTTDRALRVKAALRSTDP